jgi:hypothetical protein
MSEPTTEDPAVRAIRVNLLIMQARNNVDYMIKLIGVEDMREIARAAADYADLRADLAKSRQSDPIPVDLKNLHDQDATFAACRKLGPSRIRLVGGGEQ